MRFLTGVVFALAVASGLCAPSGSNVEGKDRMRDFAEAFRDYQVAVLATRDPLHLRNVQSTHVTSTRIPFDVVYSAKNRMIHNLSNVEINILSTNPDRLTMAYTLRYPNLVYTSDFQVEGSALKQSVSGQGSSRLTLDGATNQVNVTLEEVKSGKSSYIQIASLEQNIQYEAFTAKFTGLTVGTLTEEQIETVFEQIAAEEFLKNIGSFEKLQAKQAKQQMNMLLFGHGLEEVTAWMREHSISGTALPALSLVGLNQL